MKRFAATILALCFMLLTAAFPALAQDYDTANYRKTMIQMLAAAHDVARNRGWISAYLTRSPNRVTRFISRH